MPNRRKNKKSVCDGLVLTGGGARAAYQVGVLRAISKITKFEKNPFQIISGFSAGAINGTWLASRCESFDEATQNMWNEWANLTTEQVFKTSSTSLMGIALRWLKDRSMGGFQQSHQITYLLDTTPLDKFIRSHIDFARLNGHLESGGLRGLSVTAANYHTGHSTAFFSGSEEIKNWQSLNRISVRGKITAEQIMASAAIPIFFPPIKVAGDYYGDGMVRLNAPLSPAIHMGAERLLVIGIRGASPTGGSEKHNGTISVSEIAGTILNGLFFDSLDADLARMERVNRTLSVMTEDERIKQTDHLRCIPLLSLRPTTNVGNLPSCQLSHLPSTLRFLLRGIGVTEEKGMDLLSYLSFEKKYIHSLLELGYEDTLKKADQVRAFFEID